MTVCGDGMMDFRETYYIRLPRRTFPRACLVWIWVGILRMVLLSIKTRLRKFVFKMKKDLQEIPIKHIQNVSQYYTIAQSKENWVVVLYEKWCGYSQVTIKMLDELRKNADFIKSGVSATFWRQIWIKLFVKWLLSLKLRFN